MEDVPASARSACPEESDALTQGAEDEVGRAGRARRRDRPVLERDEDGQRGRRLHVEPGDRDRAAGCAYVGDRVHECGACVLLADPDLHLVARGGERQVHDGEQQEHARDLSLDGPARERERSQPRRARRPGGGRG